MKIGILQAGDSPEELQSAHGNYDDMSIRLLEHKHADFRFEVFRVIDSQLPNKIELCDGWLITGSKFSVYGKQPWIPALKDFIRQIVDTGQPLVGICFGHQIIADALGGRVEKSAKGWGLGLDTYTLSNDLPIDKQKLTLPIFHQDQVVEIPPGAKIYASSDFCSYAGMMIGDQVMTIQAHPEYNNKFVRQLIALRKTNVIPEGLANEAIVELDKPTTRTDSDQLGVSMSDFFTSHHSARP